MSPRDVAHMGHSRVAEGNRPKLALRMCYVQMVGAASERQDQAALAQEQLIYIKSSNP